MKKVIVSVGLLACVLGCEAKEVKTFGRHVPERKDDFAWENDLIAFRAYGPAARKGKENNGFDCWLKRVSYPIINKWYKQNANGMSYHKDHGEGHDPYHVGHSAGTGGTGIWLNGKRHGLETYTKYQVLDSSAEQTQFKLTYEHTIEGSEYREEKVISIELGDRYFSVDSTFYKDGKVAVGLPICIGVSTHDGKAQTLSSKEKGWIACWEKIGDAELGTGALMEPGAIDEIKVVKEKKKDNSHIFMITKTDSQGKLSYKAGYGWTKAGEITSVEQWKAYLDSVK